MIYGANIRMPAMNVIGTFFGIGQVQLPVANFPRLILMYFILFCLIIRTAYQGVLFELITSDIKKPAPDTIEELIKLDFKFFIQNGVLFDDFMVLRDG